ncbi:hypothetical protein AHYW_002474 [Providencia manganoxydans]
MGTKSLFMCSQGRLLFHHEIVMVRLVTGFFIACSTNTSLKGAPLCSE